MQALLSLRLAAAAMNPAPLAAWRRGAARHRLSLPRLCAFRCSRADWRHAQRREQLAGQLALREKQLALCVSHLEQGKTESDTLRTIGSAEERRLRSTLDDHDAQLVHLVKELYELATAERVPGVVAHEARSRVFRRCALVYEMLGEGAFRKADENVATAAQALEALGGYSSGKAAAGDTHRVP